MHEAVLANVHDYHVSEFSLNFTDTSFVAFVDPETLNTRRINIQNPKSMAFTSTEHLPIVSRLSICRPESTEDAEYIRVVKHIWGDGLKSVSVDEAIITVDFHTDWMMAFRCENYQLLD